MRPHLAARSLILACFGWCLISSAFSQDVSGNLTADISDGFSFAYPKGWTLTNTSSGNLQQYRVSPPTGNAVIIISTPDVKVSTYSDFLEARSQTSQQFFDKIIARFRASGTEKVEDHCEKVLNLVVPGERITGSYDKVPSTADFTYFALRKRFFSVIALRENTLNSVTEDALKLIARTITFKNDAGGKANDFIIDAKHAGVLNGKALKLPKPVPPRTEYPATEDVVVSVDVLIDENGDVIWAGGIPSLRQYHANARMAAREAKFEPTLICGVRARVFGTITYLFKVR